MATAIVSLIGMGGMTYFFLMWLRAERKLAKHGESQIFKKDDSENE